MGASKMKKAHKLLSIITASAMAFSCVGAAAAVQTEQVVSSALAKTVYGDVDHNGYVSLADVIELMKHAIGSQIIPEDNLSSAGMSSNIQLRDAVDVMKIANSGDLVRVTGAKLSTTSKTVKPGESFSLGASVTPSNATNKYFSYTTSNSSVATVDSSGKVTAKAAGSATISARSVDGGYTASCKLTVSGAEEGVITVDGVKYELCDNYSSSYLYDQRDYSKFVSGGSNVGCSATAEAIGASMYYGKTIKPDDSQIGWISGVGATFWLADVRYYNISVSSKLSIAYNQLKKGNPSIINTLNYSDHWVTIIGVKPTANPNSLKTSDFLIANPWGGTLSNLDSYLSSTGRYIPNSYSMRTYE